MLDNYAEIDLRKMRQNGIYGNELNNFLSTIGKFDEDWSISPMVFLNSYAPFKVYFKTPDTLMALYLAYSDYILEYKTTENGELI